MSLKKSVLAAPIALTLLILSFFTYGWSKVNQRFLCENCSAKSIFQNFSQKTPPARLLVIAVDGVPFRVFEELQSQGYFKNFKKPAKMVSPFPSLTKLSFSQILNGGPREGYERIYFDHQSNSLKASYGIFEHMFIFEKKVDELSFLGSPGYIGYATPHPFEKNVLVGMKKRILNSPEKTFFGYTSVTDFLSHSDGEVSLKSFLIELEQLITDVQMQINEPLCVVLFSDHGNSLIHGQRIDLSEVLEKNGFRNAKTLTQESDFILPINGLVGIASIHTQSNEKQKMCHLISQVEGVDLCLRSEKEGVYILSSQGHQSLVKQVSHRKISYQSLGKDPLGYIEENKTIVLSEPEWWDLTKDHYYPDGLRRVLEAFGNLVKNPGQILVSLKDGFVVGPKILAIPLELKKGNGGTHGGLHANQSLGFFATNFLATPKHVQASWLYDMFKQAALKEPFVIPYMKGSRL